MKIALMYAMTGEIASLLHESAVPTQIAGVSFYELQPDLIACCGGIGKVNAAMAAQLLIEHYHPDLILNAGVAGCLETLPIGTTVLVDRFMQHDVDTTAIGDPIGLVSTVNLVEFPTARLDAAHAALTAAGIDYRVGSCATGDWFVVNNERSRWIADTFHPLLCDMEGGAVAQVCHRNGVPLMALKAVSDCVFSGHETYFDFPAAMVTLNKTVSAFVAALQQ